MKKHFNNIYYFCLGAFVFGIIGVGATNLYNSNQITYKKNNVETALNELYDSISNNTSHSYYLGTGTSFDIKTKYPDIDYTTLTADNFIVGVSSIGRVNATGVTGGSHRYISAYITGFNLSKTYDNTTGILTIGGTSYSLTSCNDESFIYCRDAYGSSNAVPFVYLILGDVQQ